MMILFNFLMIASVLAHTVLKSIPTNPVLFVDEDWNTNGAFFKALGSRDKEIRSAEPDDEAEIVREEQEVLLYRYI